MPAARCYTDFNFDKDKYCNGNDFTEYSVNCYDGLYLGADSYGNHRVFRTI